MRKEFRLFILLYLVSFGTTSLFAASPLKLTRQEYIDRYAAIAVQEMIDYHIPASITMAQACLESADGNSVLTRQSNNHFGIKCKSNWTGPTVRHNDDEAGECFRKYRTPEESFRDHSEFLTTSNRYSFLFSYDIRDFKKWAHGLKQAGYATDPAYPGKLIKIIEEYRLYELDQLDWKYVNTTETERKHFALFGFLKKKSPDQKVGVATGYLPRKIEKRNGRKAFIAIEGDDYARIADEFGKKDWQIYQYNDARSGDVPEPGEPVFLKAKRSKAPRGNDWHVVQRGETLRSVAQWYGVKLSSLRKMNGLAEGAEVRAGEVLALRKKQ
ncbi:MAG TPA: glucosaminidase domain-containing protein [Prolixibacteraceae bacterium]|nr:glucosaminidase domain-containing protein [Prolixibacteraceae bacterium]